MRRYRRGYGALRKKSARQSTVAHRLTDPAAGHHGICAGESDVRRAAPSPARLKLPTGSTQGRCNRHDAHMGRLQRVGVPCYNTPATNAFPFAYANRCRKYVALDTGLLIGIYFLRIILGQSYASGLAFGLPYLFSLHRSARDSRRRQWPTTKARGLGLRCKQVLISLSPRVDEARLAVNVQDLPAGALPACRSRTRTSYCKCGKP